MRKISYLLILALLFIQYSCKKDPQNQDDFDKYDYYCKFSIDSTNYLVDVLYGTTVATLWTTDTISNNDSITICVGSKLTDTRDINLPINNILAFYRSAKWAINDLEKKPESQYIPYFPSVGDLMKFYPINQEFRIIQSDLPSPLGFTKLEQGAGFTWGTLSEFSTSNYEKLSNHMKSSCIVVKSLIHDSQSIKVEIDFDIYLKQDASDQIIHLKNGKLITLIFTQ